MSKRTHLPRARGRAEAEGPDDGSSRSPPREPRSTAPRRRFAAASPRDPPPSPGSYLKEFHEFARATSAFSKSVTDRARDLEALTDDSSALENVELARRIFGKWSLEIFTALFSRKAMRFQEMRNSIGGVSAQVLSQRLHALVEEGLVRRTVVASTPPQVTYSLTRHGTTVAHLGEPVFLYLRLTHKMRKAGANDGTVVPATEL